VKVYTRRDRHLVIFPDLPQWAVVTDDGLRILRMQVDEGMTREAAIKRCTGEDPEVIGEQYDDLAALHAPSEGLTQVVSGMLTPRTTIAMIAVTRSCNLRCPHCYVDACGVQGPELTIDEHRRIATQLVRKLATSPDVTYRINLTGGEPFAHQDIQEIVQAYLDACLEVTISTNALLITDLQADWLARNEVILQVSLDGATAPTHDVIRGLGMFNLVTDRIQALVSKGVKVGVNHLVHEGNFAELEATISLTHRLGCSGFNPINLVQLGRACDSPLVRVPEVRIFEHLSRYLTTHPEQVGLFERTSLFSSLGAALLSGITCASCGVGNRPCVYIAPEGDVYPCANTQRDEFCLGNLRQETSTVSCETTILSSPSLGTSRWIRSTRPVPLAMYAASAAATAAARPTT